MSIEVAELNETWFILMGMGPAVMLLVLMTLLVEIWAL